MLCLLMAMALITAPQAEDARSPVALLPPAVESGVPSQRAQQLMTNLDRAVQENPGFRQIALDPDVVARLEADPGCRDQPPCLEPLLADQAHWAIEPRLRLQAGDLVLELRLLEAGVLVLRHSGATSAVGLGQTARQEINALLTGRAPDLRLYQLAQSGDAQAAISLATQFPHSPWLLALQDAARRQPPPRSNTSRPGIQVVQAQAADLELEPIAPPPAAPAPDPAPRAQPTQSFIEAELPEPFEAPKAAPAPVTAPAPEPHRPARPSRSFVASSSAGSAPGDDSQRAGSADGGAALSHEAFRQPPTPQAPPSEPGAPVPPITQSRDIAEFQVPSAMRSGTDDQRYSALGYAERRPEATAAIVWVMKNDPNNELRRKAWRVIRARWRQGSGTAADNQAAAIWVFEHRPDERGEAALAIAQYGVSQFEGRDMLAMFATALERPHGTDAYNLTAAILVLGDRNHRMQRAITIVEETIQHEQDVMRRRAMKRALLRYSAG